MVQKQGVRRKQEGSLTPATLGGRSQNSDTTKTLMQKVL